MDSRFSIDTRTLRRGDTFVAIRGEKFDGHDFLEAAVKQGATRLIVDRADATRSVPTSSVEVAQVADCLTYLAQEAQKRLDDLQTQVIAITGSVGKTTTKRAVVATLDRVFDVVTPTGNLNTLLGASLTILNEITRLNQKFIAEVGAYQRGDIVNFCKWIKPSIAVVTNVQPVHLERMGSLDNIALAKGELVDALTEQGVACLNQDDLRVAEMRLRCKGRVISYGSDAAADINPSHIKVDVPLLGGYRISTAMAAYAVGVALGLDDETINAGLSGIRPEKGRLNLLPGRNDAVIIDDTYNASLSSSLEALDVLRQRKGSRKIAIMGDMLELGATEEEAHSRVVNAALEGADVAIFVGARMRSAVLRRHLAEEDSRACFSNQAEALASLSRIFTPASGDVILVKGSAGMRMENIVEALLASDLKPAEVLVRQEKSWKTKEPESV